MKYIVSLFLAAFVAATSLNAQQARLQVIHNAADPSAALVDVYLNGSLLLDDFAFRAATPFVDVPAGVQLSIGVAPGNSTGPQDIIATFTPTLADGGSYIAVANGVLDPSMFAANPDMKNIAFTLLTAEEARESALNAGEVDLKVLHGASDAPTVDVIARGVGALVEDAAYGDMTAYHSVPAGSYTLDITPANDNNTIVASFTADLSGLGGGTALVFASGFLDPSSNMNGEVFGLFAALPDGNVVTLPAASAPQARLQVIHNAADPSAALVDIYLNGSLLLDNFAFRAATPFLDYPVGVDLTFGVAPGNSTSANDIIAEFTVNLEDRKTYIAVANGVLDPSTFAGNPDMKNIAFTLLTADDARESALNAGEVDLKILHGVTDAPSVDVIARGVGKLVEDAAYGDMTAYLSVPAGSYTLDITPANDNNTIVASFTADLSGLGGGAALVFASGFLNPLTIVNREAFGLFAALPDGTVLPLSGVTSVRRENAPLPVQALSVYPNPASDRTTLRFNVERDAAVTLRVFDISGREVYAADRGQLAPGQYDAGINFANLTTGLYRVVLSTSAGISSTMVSVVR